MEWISGNGRLSYCYDQRLLLTPRAFINGKEVGGNCLVDIASGIVSSHSILGFSPVKKEPELN